MFKLEIAIETVPSRARGWGINVASNRSTFDTGPPAGGLSQLASYWTSLGVLTMRQRIR